MARIRGRSRACRFRCTGVGSRRRRRGEEAIATSGLEAKSLDSPDETRPFKGHGHVDLVNLDTGPIGRGVFEPGWRWSQDVKPIAGTDSCQVEHIGYVLSGRMVVRMDDGEEHEYAPGEAFHMRPGHDAWTVGDEPCVMIDVGGLKGYAANGG